MISVILPCYNVEQFIEEALDSLLNQTYSDLEIICLNDGSTDNTRKIIEKYREKDLRIKAYNNDRNMGLVYTLNKLVELANSDIIARMDPDDVCQPNRIELLYKKLIEGNYDLVSSDYCLIDEQSKYIKKKGLSILTSKKGILFTAIFNSPFPHPQSMMRKSIFSNKHYDPNFKATEDYKLWTELLLNPSFKATILKQELYKYRINSNSVSNKNSDLQALNHIKIAKTFTKNIIPIFNEKINFWAIANGLYDYDSVKDVGFQLSSVRLIRDSFIQNMLPDNYELEEINNYTFQYYVYLYLRILRDGDKGNLTLINRLNIIFKSMYENIDLLNFNRCKWILKSL